MPADLEKYRPHVEGYDLTESQKTELLETLWGIMEAFADRAFGLHPAQQILKEKNKNGTNPAGNRVDSNNKLLNQSFGSAADISRRQEDEDS